MPVNAAYTGPRPDIAALVPADAHRILDVGCSVGAFGAALRQSRNVHVYGIEGDPDMAAIAATRLDHVYCGDVERTTDPAMLPETPVDCIVFGDVLEHLVDPWQVVRRCVAGLRHDGTVVISIPNVRHFSTLWNLVRGRWPRRDRGLFDRTHLRWFTRGSVVELCEQSGLVVEKLVRSYRLVDRPSRINMGARLVAVPGLRDFVAYQFLLRARKRAA